MAVELTVVPTVALTFIIAGLISSGSRQWFGKPVVLSVKQYLLRCSLVASIILGTLFSLCQADFVKTLLDQKILILLTMASSIAVDHYYGLRAPRVEEGTGTKRGVVTEHAKRLREELSKKKVKGGRRRSRERERERRTFSISEGGLSHSDASAGAEAPEDTADQVKGGKDKAPSKEKSQCRAVPSEDEVTHFSVPPTAFNEHHDHQCLHVHLKEPARLHIVPKKERQERASAPTAATAAAAAAASAAAANRGANKKTSPRAVKALEPSPEVELVSYGGPAASRGDGEGLLRQLLTATTSSPRTELVSVLGSLLVVGSLVLAEGCYSTSCLLQLANALSAKAALTLASVVVPLFLYCWTFLDGSGYSAGSSTLVLPSASIARKHHLTSRGNGRSSACMCFSQAGLWYVGVLIVAALSFLGVMVQYFPRNRTPPPRFYQTCTGRLLIVTLLLLLGATGIIIHLYKNQRKDVEAEKTKASNPHKHFVLPGKSSSVQSGTTAVATPRNAQLAWSGNQAVVISDVK